MVVIGNVCDLNLISYHSNKRQLKPIHLFESESMIKLNSNLPG